MVTLYVTNLSRHVFLFDEILPFFILQYKTFLEDSLDNFYGNETITFTGHIISNISL